MKVKINLLQFFAPVLKIFITVLKDSFHITPKKDVFKFEFSKTTGIKTSIFLYSYNFLKHFFLHGISFANSKKIVVAKGILTIENLFNAT